MSDQKTPVYCRDRHTADALRRLRVVASAALDGTKEDREKWTERLIDAGIGPDMATLFRDMEPHQLEDQAISREEPQLPGMRVPTEAEDQRRSINFAHHPPNHNQVRRMQEIRAAAGELSRLLDRCCAPSRELSLAQTRCEELVMWANAAIARHETGEQPPGPEDPPRGNAAKEVG